MQVEVIKIGNSRGIRIPKALLTQCHIDKKVTLTVVDGSLIVNPCCTVRAGWEEAAIQMAAAKDDKLLDKDVIHHSWDEEEWEW